MSNQTVHWGKKAPYRTLRVTSPLTRGEDVEALQTAINSRAEARGLPTIRVDGQYGPATDAAADAVAYALGLAVSTVRRNGASVGVQRIIRKPSLRDPEQEQRARRRADSPGGPQKAIAWARSKKGVSEHPAGSNHGPEIDAWQGAVGLPGGGYAWCGAFLHAAVLAGGVDLTDQVRYVPWIESNAKAGTGGFVKWVGPRDIKPGDAVCFDFDGGVGDHTGLAVSVDLAAGTVTCIEGNTSSSARGSQSNGGMVAERTRPLSVVRGAGRPRWPSA